MRRTLRVLRMPDLMEDLPEVEVAAWRQGSNRPPELNLSPGRIERTQLTSGLKAPAIVSFELRLRAKRGPTRRAR